MRFLSHLCHTSSVAVLSAATVLVSALTPGLAHADSFKITVEAPDVQSANQAALCGNLGAGICTIGTENFDTRSSGQAFTTNYGTNGTITGTYSPVQINSADVFGGAGGTGSYAVAFGGSTYSVSLQTTLPTGINYFGYWLSALDGGNLVTFFRNGTAVYQFLPNDLLAQLGVCANPYCGNPNNNTPGNLGQLYAFVNFFDQTGTFDEIRFTENPVVGGYESDNHTVGYVSTETGTPVNSPVPEPATLTLVGSGLLAAFSRRRWMTGRS